MKTLDQVIRFVAIATALTGCASGGNIHFHTAASSPSAEHVAKLDAPFAIPIPSAEIVAFEEAPVESVAIDALPVEDVALLQPESAHEYARSFALAPHVSMALSFHCTSGEESLGCKAKPVEPFIERDVDAIFGRE